MHYVILERPELCRESYRLIQAFRYIVTDLFGDRASENWLPHALGAIVPAFLMTNCIARLYQYFPYVPFAPGASNHELAKSSDHEIFRLKGYRVRKTCVFRLPAQRQRSAGAEGLRCISLLGGCRDVTVQALVTGFNRRSATIHPGRISQAATGESTVATATASFVKRKQAGNPGWRYGWAHEHDFENLAVARSACAHLPNAALLERRVNDVPSLRNRCGC